MSLKTIKFLAPYMLLISKDRKLLASNMVAIVKRNTFPNHISVYSNFNFLTQMMPFAEILLPGTLFISRIGLRNNTVCCLVDQVDQEDRSVCLPCEEGRQSFSLQLKLCILNTNSCNFLVTTHSNHSFGRKQSLFCLCFFWYCFVFKYMCSTELNKNTLQNTAGL